MLNGISFFRVSRAYHVLLLVLAWTLDALSYGLACASTCRRLVRKWARGLKSR